MRGEKGEEASSSSGEIEKFSVSTNPSRKSGPLTCFSHAS